MSTSVTVITNRVNKRDDITVQNRQIAYRAEELADYARVGYQLAHTATIDGDEHVVFIDTLTRST